MHVSTNIKMVYDDSIAARLRSFTPDSCLLFLGRPNATKLSDFLFLIDIPH